MTKHINIDPLDEILLNINGATVKTDRPGYKTVHLSVIQAKTKLNQLIAKQVLDKQIGLLEHLMTSNPTYTHAAAKDILIDLKSELEQLRSKE